jgi:anti-sigma factor RsiW
VTGQHPFDKLAAAVDGQLDHDSRDRVFGHLVGCETCKAEIEEQRRLKARLGLLDTPEPPSALLGRLLAVPEFGTEPREEVRPVPAVTLRPARSVFPAAQTRPATRNDARPVARTAPAAPARPNRRRAVVVSAAGSAAAVVSLLGTAFVVGEPTQQRAPLLQPPVSSFSVDHATSTGGYPFGDQAAMLTTLNGSGYAGLGTPSTLLRPTATTGR